MSKYASEYEYETLVDALDLTKKWLETGTRFPYDVVGSELELNFYIKQYKIKGFIDRLDQISNEIYQIVDYKTGTYEYKNVDNSLQFDIYSVGIFKLYEEVKALQIVYENVRYGTRVEKTVTREEADILEKRVSNYIEAIEDDTNFSARLDYNCTYCEFKNRCEDFQEWMKVDGKVIDDDVELGRLFLEYRTKSKYYSDQLEEIKELLKMKIDYNELEVGDKVISISEKGVYVRNRR